MNTNIDEALKAFNSPKIRAIAEKSALSYVNLLSHRETEITETMQELEEGQSLTIGHSLKLDIEKNRQTDRVSFSAKYVIDHDCEIPNPDQPELPNVEGGAE
jgi:hypothetical protein